MSEQEQLEETHSWSRYSNRVWNTAQQYLLNGVDVVTGYTGNATGRISALVGSGWQKKSGDSEAIGNFVAQLIKTVEGIRNVTVCVETDDGAVYQFKMASQDLG